MERLPNVSPLAITKGLTSLYYFYRSDLWQTFAQRGGFR